MKFVSSAHLVGGGTISGDVTIDGDLTVNGGGGFSYSEVLTGDMIIDQDANAKALTIDSQSADHHVLFIDAPVTAGASVIRIDSAGALTTGHLFNANITSTALATTANDGAFKIDHTANSGSNVNNLMYLHNNDANSTGTTVLKLVQDSTGNAMESLGKVKIKTDGTDEHGLDIRSAFYIHKADGTKGGMIGYDNGEVMLSFASNNASSGINFITHNGGSWGERLRIHTDGNIGIGTDSPDANLELEKDGADQELRLSCHSDTEAHTSSLTFFKSDNTAASPATIDAGAVLGQVIFNGYDDNSYDTGSKIVAMADANWSSTERGTKLSFYTRDANSALSENLIINADGSATFAGKVEVNGYGLTLVRSAPVIEFNDTDESGSGDGGGKFKIASDNDRLGFFGRADDDSTWNERVVLKRNGQVGIGTTSPSPIHADYSALQVGGQGFILSATTAGADKSVYIGNNAFKHTDGSWDTVANDESMLYEQHGGKHYFYIAPAHASVSSLVAKFIIDSDSKISLSNNDSGTGNTIFGHTAGNAITGGYSTFIGYHAGLVHTTGGYNMAIGYGAMDDTNAGSNSLGSTENIFIGVDSGGGTWANTASSYNVALGSYTMDAALDGAIYNVSVGYRSLTTLTEGDYNTVVGAEAGLDQTTAVANSFFGFRAGYDIVGGGENTFIGSGAGLLTTAVVGATLIGRECGGGGIITTGANHTTAVGYQALYALTSGGNNIAIGYKAGGTIETGASNVFIGHQSGQTTHIDSTANVAIGRQSFAGTHTGSASTSNVAIGNLAMGAGACNAADNNVAVGDSALEDITEANGNVCVGFESGTAITTGIHNICIGYQAGNNITESQGNVLIGTGAAAAHATASSGDDSIVIAAGTDAVTSAGTETIRIGVDSDYITNDFGENATWTHSSDKRIKKDIKDNTLGLDFINDLRTVTFKKKAPSEYPKKFDSYNKRKTIRKTPDRINYGFIAQEVKASMDKAGHSEFPVWKENDDTMQELGEAELITPLVKAIQELTAKVKELEAKLK